MFKGFLKGIRTNKQLIKKLEQLNPQIEFDYDDRYGWIMVSCHAEQLRLPKRFYYNEKIGITNKHQTKNGQYICLTVI